MKLRITKKENIVPLGYSYIDDTVDQYYRPIQGYFMRKRLEIALSLLGHQRIDTILDAGYGGGTFLPTLTQLANRVYGIDTMPYPRKVKTILEREGVDATLTVGSLLRMPYPENFFDSVVCISVLEHFNETELHTALREMNRVTKPNGRLVLGFPVKNPATDLIIERVLGFDPSDIHPSGHKRILQAIREETNLDQTRHYFPFLPRNWSLYCAARAIKAGH